MAITIVTDVTEEPITVSEQKAHLRMDGDEDDGYIATCIKAARQWIEGETHRAILTKTLDLTIDWGWPLCGGVPRIEIPVNPVKAIGATSPEVFSITYVDSGGNTQTLAQSQYTLVSRTHNSYIVPAYGATWPNVRPVPNAVTVRFAAGDAAAPEQIKQAVKILAAHYYENRETASDAPHSVEALISPYRASRFA